MIEIRRYTAADKSVWNDFVANAKNSTFKHNRNYMDYHSDRFVDFSLMAYNSGKLVAVLPANISGTVLYSHQGLTYGGWLTPVKHFTANTMMEVFASMRDFLKSQGITKLVYKAVPHIFHRYPAEEDLYALFRFGARLTVVNISSTIDYSVDSLPFDRRSRRNCDKAKAAGIEVRQSDDYAAFWNILSSNLQSKYGVAPVHTLDEMLLLKARFPKEISLWMSYRGETPLAGVVMFDHGSTVHAQYSSANAEGLECGALSYLFATLIKDIYSDRRYYDFGISNEDGGQFLNEKLIEMKAGNAARGIAFNIYELDI